MRSSTKYAIFAAAFAGFGATVCGAAVTPPNDKDLSKGEWELNVAKSKFGCGKPPQVSKRHIVDAGWGMTFVEWTGIQADGKPFETHYVYRYDGQRYPVGIDRPDAKEAIIYTLKNPHHIDFVHVDKEGKVTSNYYRDISADGQTMTQSNKTVGRDCEDLQVFERR
jgi:hypothetical protein